ncbi:MAG: ABC transporter ATP-binding protein [Longimicrobiales bacterium]
MSSSQHPLESGRPRVSARELRVSYGTNKSAGEGLKGFTADFHPGITGLVGPNGAGKTTFLRTVAGLLRPSRGRLEIHGMDPGAFLARGGIGFLPENPVFPRYLTVREFLKGLCFGADPERTKAREFEGALQLQGIFEQRLDCLSLGQRKKVALSAACLGEPRVMLLDEPTNGLDPIAVRGLRQALMVERERRVTVIVSSHHLDELQRIADALVFLKDGVGVGAWARDAALTAFGSLEVLFDHVFVGGK